MHIIYPYVSTANAKTPAKWRTREWHLANAAWAPSQPAQNQMQGRVMQDADTGADQHISSSRVRGFERGSAHLATQPLRLKDSKRKGASARPGLEPEPYGRERRARARAPELLISSARMSKFL